MKTLRVGRILRDAVVFPFANIKMLARLAVVPVCLILAATTLTAVLQLDLEEGTMRSAIAYVCWSIDFFVLCSFLVSWQSFVLKGARYTRRKAFPYFCANDVFVFFDIVVWGLGYMLIAFMLGHVLFSTHLLAQLLAISLPSVVLGAFLLRIPANAVGEVNYKFRRALRVRGNWLAFGLLVCLILVVGFGGDYIFDNVFGRLAEADYFGLAMPVLIVGSIFRVTYLFFWVAVLGTTLALTYRKLKEMIATEDASSPAAPA